MQTSEQHAAHAPVAVAHIELAHPWRWAAIYAALIGAVLGLSEIWPWGFAS